MALTLPEIDAQIMATDSMRKSFDTELQREVASLRIDHLLDLRYALTHPPVAPAYVDPLAELGDG